MDQCEGIKARFAAQLPQTANADTIAEAIIAGYVRREGITLEHVEGDRAGLETAKSFRNSAAYVQSWLQALKNDKRFIVSAAGKAEKAVALIMGE